MNQYATQHIIEREVSESTQLASLNLIRTETVLSRLPIHNLAKKGRVDIKITKKNAQGKVDLYWRVSPNPDFGEPRQLAYKLDTIIINQKIDELGRPLPKIIRLGSLHEIAQALDLVRNTNAVKKAFLQDASTFITAKLRYKANDGTERTLEAGFTRYSVVFTGERLPDGTRADAVYLILNDPYWEVINNAPTRPLNYDYLKALTPAAQRFYEIVSYRIFTALKYRHPHAKLFYSDYCTFSAQQRYTDYDHFKKQMYKVHRPHKASGYLEKVSYEASTDSNGTPDWMMYYVPGPKAKAEYDTCNGNKKHATDVATESATLLPLPATANEPSQRRGEGRAQQGEPHTEQPQADHQHDDRLTAEARDLISYFHQRFHGAPNNAPHPNALNQATKLMVKHGMAKARHIVDFAYNKAKETHYEPATLAGILHYTPQALADYDQAQQRKDAAATAREAQRKAEEEQQLRRQYEDYCAARLAEVRATTPPAVIAAIEAAAAAQFDQENTSRFGRDRLRRYAIDDAVAAQLQIPSLEAWHATQGRS
jgi:hypothetical protein